MDWLLLGKPCTCQFDIDLMATGSQMKSTPHSVARNDLQRRVLGAHIASEAEAAEDRIIGNDGGDSAKCAAVTEIGFGRVVPGTATMRLSKPGHAVGCRLETAACTTIVFFAGKPVAEATFRCASIHQ